jgi:hypothetical protein
MAAAAAASAHAGKGGVSLWVGDLDPTTDESLMYQIFSSYSTLAPSVRVFESLAQSSAPMQLTGCLLRRL